MVGSIVLPQPRGTYTIIRTNGRIESYTEKPSFPKLLSELRCDAIDTVTLTKRDDMPETVMMCDDTGMLDQKPVNDIATGLYLSRCVPGATWNIYGDVAIVNDRDFGSL